MKNKNKELLNLALVLFLSFIMLYYLNIHYAITLLIIYILQIIIRENNFDKKNIIKYILCFTICTYITKKIISLIIINQIIQCLSSSVFITFFSSYFSNVRNIDKFVSKFINIIKQMNEKWLHFIKYRPLATVFKFLPQNLFIFALFLLSCLTLKNFINYSNNFYDVYTYQKATDNIGPIVEKTKIDLDFIETKEKFSHICLRFGTYNRRNKPISFVVEDKAKKIIINKKINTNSLTNLGFKCLNVEGLTLEKLKTYDVYLVPSKFASKNNSVTILTDKKTKNIDVKLSRIQSNDLKIIKNTIFIFSIFTFLIINYYINTKKLTQNKFLLMTLLYIIPILFIFPPLNAPDEEFHFYKSYGLSQMFSTNKSSMDLVVPKNIQCLKYAQPQVSNKVENINNIGKCIKSKDNTTIYNTYMNSSTILGYISQAIGIKIADIISNSPYVIYYSGRLFNLLVSFILLYYAIKITPKHKNLFLICGTIPMFIQQMISYSYDSILNSAILLNLAVAIKMIYSKEKIKAKDAIIPIILSVLILNIKYIYLPLAILFCFIPASKFKNKKSKIVIIIFSVICSFLLYKLFDLLATKMVPAIIQEVSSPSNISKQLTYLKNHIFEIPQIAVNTIKLNKTLYLNGIIGFFGWFAFKISDIYIYIYALLLLYTILGDENKLKNTNKAVLFIITLGCLIGIFGAMYLCCSVPKSAYVDGVQGRYILPLIIPFSLCIMPKKRKYDINNKNIYSAINIILLQVILTFAIWFY